MASQIGFNLSASDMKSLLERIDKQQSGVRTWRQLFGNASLGYSAQSSALTSDYASAIAEAYKTNQAQRSSLMGAGLNVGATKELLVQSRNDLRTAYDTYVRNFATNASALAESYNKEVTGINDDLTKRASNFIKLYNDAYKYLSEELYGSYMGDKNYFTENNLDWAFRRDDKGNLTTDLMSWDELSHILFDENAGLTAQGTEFFDQMFNAQPQGYKRLDKDNNEVAVRSFDSWLSDTDAELRDWWASADLYNYNRAGTNAGTAKVLAGMESDDQKYHKREYLTPEYVTANLDTYSVSTELHDIIIELSDVEKQREDIYQKAPGLRPENRKPVRGQRRATQNEMAYSQALASYGSRANTLRDDIKTRGKKEIADMRAKVDEKYTKYLGKEDFSDFWDKNKELAERYNNLISDIRVDTLVFDFNTWLRDYNKALAEYVKQHPKSKKSSGF